MTKKIKFKLIHIPLVLLLVLSFLILLLVLEFELMTMGEVTPRLVNDQVVFDINHGGTSGLLKLTLSDLANKEVLWDVKLNNYFGSTLEYGEVPEEFETSNGAINQAKQRFPENDAPPPKLLNGRIYKVQCDWQYDYWIAPTYGGTTQYFMIEHDRVILFIPEVVD